MTMHRSFAEFPRQGLGQILSGHLCLPSAEQANIPVFLANSEKLSSDIGVADVGIFQAMTEAGHDGTLSYILRPLVDDIPLSDDGSDEVHITCLELCEENLYIGTSRAEVLHFVSIPVDPAEASSGPTFIFASRLQPVHNASASSQSQPGVQQILVLPIVQKACVLCNGTLSFYTLPELSPAFGTTVANCTYVGGLDLNETGDDEEHGAVVMICAKNKVRLVRIADEVRRVRDIQYAGCLASARRGDYACVADAHGYALLDVQNQQKISLFPISSFDDNPAAGKVEDISAGVLSPPRQPAALRTDSRASGHGRSTSLGALVGALGSRQASPRPSSQERSGRLTPEPPAEGVLRAQPVSHTRTESTPENQVPPIPAENKPLPIPPRLDSLKPPPLTPHITSHISSEFLLTTGTSAVESGVGIFVNLDGDVVRGTIEFSRYPSSVVVDADTTAQIGQQQPQDSENGFVLATMARSINGSEALGVEIQRWNAESSNIKEWLQFSAPRSDEADSTKQIQQKLSGSKIKTVLSPISTTNQEIGALLRAGRMRLPGRAASPDMQVIEAKRNREEVAFGQRLGGGSTRIVLWSDKRLWSVSKNLLIMKLDLALNRAIAIREQNAVAPIDRSQMIQVVSSIRDEEPSTETAFLSIEYVRQKASVFLFGDLIGQSRPLANIASADLRITEVLLKEGGVDPRVILSLIPPLLPEIIEGKGGIWVYAGLIRELPALRKGVANTSRLAEDRDFLQLVKRYLIDWRQRKGFGSIADESEVFQSVDAALLKVLLVQDTHSISTPSKPSSQRAELYSFVDSGVDCFDRAVAILEEHHRLYTLSRLYQSKRQSRKVLETWQRIIQGSKDIDRGFLDGENEIRKYLINIRDHGIVDEFGTWLAERNPSLGVQVFTNESSKVKWEPHQVVMLLRRRAPDAVKVYLEHLVFGKKNVRYANDLISYYLDSVLSVLGSLDTAKDQLARTYEVYRALRPPKPTYREYITENALDEPWWHDRLRLLELIGGSHGSGFSYNVQEVLSRIEPFEEDLVPESIILDGRQGRHKQALRLLTHGLGDYHTAVNYCLLGGASMFHPTQGSVAAPSQEEQSLLFNHLLTEFLRIEDVSDRLEQTSELLARFSGWFDVKDVLVLIPESWSVELVSGFLVGAFRKLVQERNEAMIVKALSGAENLQVASDFVEKCKDRGPQFEKGEAA